MVEEAVTHIYNIDKFLTGFCLGYNIRDMDVLEYIVSIIVRYPVLFEPCQRVQSRMLTQLTNGLCQTTDLFPYCNFIQCRVQVHGHSVEIFQCLIHTFFYKHFHTLELL